MTPTTWQKRFGARQADARDEKRKIESEKGKSTMQTLRSEQERLKEERLQILRTSLHARKEREERMREIEKENSANVPSTIPENRTPSSIVPAVIYGMVGSDSMSLIDESAKHLHERMKSTKNVLEACVCAEQIGKLIRLKLDIKKAGRE